MCTLKTSPCVPAPRPHVVTLAHVVPVHTETLSMYTRGEAWAGVGVQRDTPTPTHWGRGEGVNVTHQHQHQHTQIAHQQHTQRTTHRRSTHNTEHARWHRQFCLPKFAHVRLSLDLRGSPKKPLDLKHFQFGLDRDQRVPDSSNHSLHLIKLFNFSSPEGHF